MKKKFPPVPLLQRLLYRVLPEEKRAPVPHSFEKKIDTILRLCDTFRCH